MVFCRDHRSKLASSKEFVDIQRRGCKAFSQTRAARKWGVRPAELHPGNRTLRAWAGPPQPWLSFAMARLFHRIARRSRSRRASRPEGWQRPRHRASRIPRHTAPSSPTPAVSRPPDGRARHWPPAWPSRTPLSWWASWHFGILGEGARSIHGRRQRSCGRA